MTRASRDNGQSLGGRALDFAVRRLARGRFENIALPQDVVVDRRGPELAMRTLDVLHRPEHLGRRVADEIDCGLAFERMEGAVGACSEHSGSDREDAQRRLVYRGFGGLERTGDANGGDSL